LGRSYEEEEKLSCQSGENCHASRAGRGKGRWGDGEIGRWENGRGVIGRGGERKRQKRKRRKKLGEVKEN
jgi:hypothetical protein